MAGTDRLTLLGLAPRSREGANSLGVLPDFRGVVVHDSLSLYDGYSHARHQLCGSRLVWEVTVAEQDHPDQRWHRQVRWALAEPNKQAKEAKDAGLVDISPERALIYLRAYHHGIAVGLSPHPLRTRA